MGTEKLITRIHTMEDLIKATEVAFQKEIQSQIKGTQIIKTYFGDITLNIYITKQAFIAQR